MNFAFYPRLALDGIRKNRQLYLPYLLTCIGMVMMYFILASLAVSPVVASISAGAKTTQILLGLGRNLIAIFAVVFLFYTNSFLMRRRRKEFGLYNILGMSKHNLARILIWESAFSLILALLGGIVSGVLFYKLAELALVRIMNGEIVYSIRIVWSVIPQTGLIFGGIFLLLFVSSLLKMRMTKPIELLHSENIGEKPPKANVLLGFAGLALLGAGYYLAASSENPITLITEFFLAVLLVIAGTYLTFIAGSVVLCRILQKNRRYYYRPNHFVSVSSMTYRMKRNGAGLASICILSTAVLVIMSAALSLFVGIDDIFQANYPTDFDVKVGTYARLSEEQKQVLTDFAADGLSVENESTSDYIYAIGSLEDGYLRFSDVSEFQGFWEVYVIDVATYNKLSGATVMLENDEILFAASKEIDGLLKTEQTSDGEATAAQTSNGQSTTAQASDNLSCSDLTSDASSESPLLEIESVGTFRVKETVVYLSAIPQGTVSIYYSALIVLNDPDVFSDLIQSGASGERELSAYYMWNYSFDAQESADDQIANYDSKSGLFSSTVRSLLEDAGYDDAWTGDFESRAANLSDYYSLFGGIFFLAIFLTALFLLATMLIIYYKQISEGFEDAARFEIMQKVGMTRADIRRSINSQMLTVFLLPVGMAGLHMICAFTIVRKMLLMFGLTNTSLFIGTTCGCFALFAVIYAVVYRITSNAYYRIVSN